MKIKSFNLNHIAALLLLSLVSASYSFAKENIIKQEKMSFAQCLKVISTSQDKLSLPPNISKISDQMRLATFTLSDGVLTITCDGIKGLVTVSTKLN